MHPNGQIPAYEWAFGDVNPPVHAWAAWRVFQIDRKRHGGAGDLEFLERVFHKLTLNFTWWVNRKDTDGRNVFQGGFLGLDNIGVFDRSTTLPTGGRIDQADATSWMAMYALNLMRIALELATHNRVYEDIATKFFEHFLQIAAAMGNFGESGIGLWDDDDKFFYDVLHLPDGGMMPLKVRSMVGLIPLFAVETIEPELLDDCRTSRHSSGTEAPPRPRPLVSHWDAEGRGQRRLFVAARPPHETAAEAMLDESEFLSDYGVRALSKVHQDHPYLFNVNGMDLSVHYVPAESDSRVFGGNSNWRGPIWFPVNYLLIESLQKFHHYYGDDFKVECPTNSGRYMTIEQVAEELSRRLARTSYDEKGLRPVFRQYYDRSRTRISAITRCPSRVFHGDTGRGSARITAAGLGHRKAAAAARPRRVDEGTRLGAQRVKFPRQGPQARKPRSCDVKLPDAGCDRRDRPGHAEPPHERRDVLVRRDVGMNRPPPTSFAAPMRRSG
jgi:hypothetical protein